MATATEPKTRKPPKVFSVTGGANGVQAEVSSYAKNKLYEAAAALEVLACASEHFPKAKAVLEALDDFNSNPTAKPAEKKP